MSGLSKNKDADQDGGGVRKKKGLPPTKLVLRRLPPAITGEELLDQLSPIPPYDYFHLAQPDSSLNPWAYGRAYISLCDVNDILTFRDRYDGYVLVDTNGNEFPIMVELAPCQKVPRKSPEESVKKDPRCGSIEEDPDYKLFLENLASPEQVQMPTIEATLEEIDKKSQERKDGEKQKTPLLEYLRIQKEKRLKREEEKRKREEERKRRAEREKQERERKQKQKEEWARMEREAAAAAKKKDKEKEKDTQADKDKGSNGYGSSSRRDEYSYGERVWKRGGGRRRGPPEPPPRFKDKKESQQKDDQEWKEKKEYSSGGFGGGRGKEKYEERDEEREERGFGRTERSFSRKQDGGYKGGFSRVKQEAWEEEDVGSPSLSGPKTVASTSKKQAESSKQNREEEYWEKGGDRKRKTEFVSTKYRGRYSERKHAGGEGESEFSEKKEKQRNLKEEEADVSEKSESKEGSSEKRRNKDRPSVQLYQPRRMRAQQKQEEEETKSGDKKSSDAQNGES